MGGAQAAGMDSRAPGPIPISARGITADACRPKDRMRSSRAKARHYTLIPEAAQARRRELRCAVVYMPRTGALPVKGTRLGWTTTRHQWCRGVIQEIKFPRDELGVRVRVGHGAR